MKIEWKGGECPVSEDTLVKVYTRNGDVKLDVAAAFYWFDDGLYCDIIAYEVIEEEPKQITEKTLRDEFALAWIINMGGGDLTHYEVAEEAYFIADAMMKAREK